jgi:hypothetical protein
MWAYYRSKLNGSGRSLGSAAIVDTVNDVLEPSADVGTVAPFVDDAQRVLQEQERAVRGPVFLRTARIWSGEHMVTPEQKSAAGHFLPAAFSRTLNSMKTAKT